MVGGIFKLLDKSVCAIIKLETGRGFHDSDWNFQAGDRDIKVRGFVQLKD